jgi:hypothetical protein
MSERDFGYLIYFEKTIGILKSRKRVLKKLEKMTGTGRLLSELIDAEIIDSIVVSSVSEEQSDTDIDMATCF